MSEKTAPPGVPGAVGVADMASFIAFKVSVWGHPTQSWGGRPEILSRGRRRQGSEVEGRADRLGRELAGAGQLAGEAADELFAGDAEEAADRLFDDGAPSSAIRTVPTWSKRRRTRPSGIG